MLYLITKEGTNQKTYKCAICTDPYKLSDNGLIVKSDFQVPGKNFLRCRVCGDYFQYNSEYKYWVRLCVDEAYMKNLISDEDMIGIPTTGTKEVRGLNGGTTTAKVWSF